MNSNTAVAQSFDSLYVHVPFCNGKCDYCAFYSTATFTAELRAAYLEKLTAEFAGFASRCQPLQSIFIGGGTPSCLNEHELCHLLGLIRGHFQLDEHVEFSMEANPDSLTSEKIRICHAHGVNRFSLGVQSFAPKHRRTIGRRGSLQNLGSLIDTIRQLESSNLNLDLIYAIPGQTQDDWLRDVERACQLGIQHLSAYSLTLEEDTPLSKRNTKAPSDETSVVMWQGVEEVAARYGLRRYEISNFSLPGRECRHNARIWHGAKYLGCGPAACSFDGSQRWTNPASLTEWLAGVPPTFDPLPSRERAAEILAFGLRTLSGWSRPRFFDCTGFDFLELRGKGINRLIAAGLLNRIGNRIFPTEMGLLFNDSIAEELL
jgi:oxygen-independent coproporphyrinogen-3 oxidase